MTALLIVAAILILVVAAWAIAVTLADRVIDEAFPDETNKSHGLPRLTVEGESGRRVAIRNGRQR